MRKLLTPENILNLLLVFVPIAIVLEYIVHAAPKWIFVTSCLAIIPLGRAHGEGHRAPRRELGAGIGGLLNATFGNAAELIIAIVALRAGLYDVVKASLTGSIIGNILLVFGERAARRAQARAQTFNRTAASLGSTLLALARSASSCPRSSTSSSEGHAERQRAGAEPRDRGRADRHLHPEPRLHPARPTSTSTPADTAARRGRGIGHARLVDRHGRSRVLLVATALVALMSEILVGAVEARRTLGLTEVFVGVIVVAIIGNAAEHSTAILVALKNKMDVAINIAIGSSIQIALFVAPVLVFLSYFIGRSRWTCSSRPSKCWPSCSRSFIIAFISQDGESNWMEGVLLLAVYVILAIAFYFPSHVRRAARDGQAREGAEAPANRARHSSGKPGANMRLAFPGESLIPWKAAAGGPGPPSPPVRIAASRRKKISASQDPQAELHREVSRSVRDRPGRRQEDRGGRRVFALPRSQRRGGRRAVVKSNVLLIGPSGTGKTLLCETLSKISACRSRPPKRPRSRRPATSTRRSRRSCSGWSTRRMAMSAGAATASCSSTRSTSSSGTGRRPRACPAKASSTRCSRSWRAPGQARRRQLHRHHEHPVHLRRRVRRPGRDHQVADARLRRSSPTTKRDNQKILDRLNSRVKPTDLSRTA